MDIDARRLARLCEALASSGDVPQRLARAAEELARAPGVTGIRIEAGPTPVGHGTVREPWRDIPIPDDPTSGTLRVAGPDPDQIDLAFMAGAARMVGLMLRDCAQPAERVRARMASVIRHLEDILIIMHQDGSWEVPYAAGHVERFGILPASPDLDTLFLRLHPQDAPATREYIEDLLHRRPAGPPPRVRLCRTDDTWRTMELIGHDALDDPAVQGLVLHLRDITELARAQRQLDRDAARLTTIFQNMDGAVLLEDGHRRIKVVNDNMIHMFGMSANANSLIGTDCSKIPERVQGMFQDPDRFVASVNAAVTEKKRRLDEEFAMTDGRTLARDYIPVWFDSEYLGHLWMYWDITNAKRVELRLREQNRTLAEMADVKTKFVASVSHELRTPLTSITGFTDLLLQGKDPLTGEQREFLQAVDRNAHRLLVLVSDLLLAARLESRQLPMDFARVDVADLARLAMREQETTAKQRDVTVHAHIPDALVVRGDGARLTQVLANLLSNAIKFSREGGTVDMTVGKADRERWRIVVRDSGVGIPAKDLAKLFRTFFRAGNVRGSTTGTGLGLVITKAIVERHGGQIEVSSEEGTGTTVTVTLPVRPPKPRPEQETPAEETQQPEPSFQPRGNPNSAGRGTGPNDKPGPVRPAGPDAAAEVRP